MTRTTKTSTERVRFRKRELFRMIGYTPHSGQTLVHRSRAQRRVLACGTRFGKSTCGAMECVAALLEPRPSALGWLVAPTYELTRRIFEQVVRAIDAHFKHRVRRYDPREHVIVITNLGGGTSELRAKSADRPESLLGEALDFLVVDESANLHENTWDEFLAPRLIDKHGWSLLLSTPHGRNWFYEQFRRGGRDPDYECWRAPSTQNPHLDAGDIESERARLTDEIFAQQFEAEFIGLPLVPCRTCGGPREGIDHWVVLQEGEDPQRCPACDGYVNKNGRTAVGIVDGKPATVFLIERGEVLPPEYQNNDLF